jgi:hypothetical protein
MVRNGYGAKFIWYEMVYGYGTNCNFVVRNGKLWYEMVMVRNDLLRFRPGLQLLSESKMLP